MPKLPRQTEETYLPTDDGGYAKPRRISKREAIEKAEMYIAKNLPRYAKKLHELAMGITVEGIKRGEPVVYLVPPDRGAIEYLMERGMGKAPQRHEITGDQGGAIQIVPWLPAPEIIEGDVIDVTPELVSLPIASAITVQE